MSFGGRVIKSGDPIEQKTQLKYASLVANAIILSNVADLSTIIARDDHPDTPALAVSLNPYKRQHILRFGQYALDMADLPPPNPLPQPYRTV